MIIFLKNLQYLVGAKTPIFSQNFLSKIFKNHNIGPRALFGAFFYSSYTVLLRRKVNHEDNMDAPMFFGFVGLFNAVLLWPGARAEGSILRSFFHLPMV
jgi:drug/metabolite transporter (DMT)-like permease